MAAITTRSTAGTGATVKNSTLTNLEVDTNFINLNVDIQSRLLKTGDTNLYLGSQANSTRFPNTIAVLSTTSAGIQKNESHNMGLVAEGTGSTVTATITGGASGGSTITVASATGILVGQAVTGTGIGTNALVTLIAGTTITLSVVNSGTPTGTATFTSFGIGVYGVGYTNGTARSGGVVGEGHVSASTDTASAIGVRGYSNDTHTGAGGYNIGLYGDAANATAGSYALFLNNGDIYTATAKTWALNGNLTFSGDYSVVIPTLSLTNALSVANGGTGATTITGLVKGNGASAFTGAVVGTDYQAPIGTITGIAKGNGSNALTSAVAGTDYQAAITATGLLKGSGAGTVTAAVGGTDYQTAQSVTGMVKSSGTTRSAAVAGTDYQAPVSATGILKSNGTSGNVTAATAGVDYVTPTGSITGSAGTAGSVANSLTAGTGITFSSGTTYNGSAAITINIGQAVATSSNVQFGSLGINTTASGVAGEIRATGNITGYYSSDRKFKENIKEVDGALNKVVSIGSKYFDWSDDYISEHGGEDGYFIQKSDFGVIAQDVQAVFPQAVKQREDGSLAVDYAKLGILSFAAISELLKRIEILESK